MILLLVVHEVTGNSRWSHTGQESGDLDQQRTRSGGVSGPSPKWPPSCQAAEKTCSADPNCFVDRDTYKRDCVAASLSSEDQCDACRLAATNLSDNDAGWDLLKCECAKGDKNCSKYKQKVNDCLEEISL